MYNPLLCLILRMKVLYAVNLGSHRVEQYSRRKLFKFQIGTLRFNLPSLFLTNLSEQTPFSVCLAISGAYSTLFNQPMSSVLTLMEKYLP